MEIAGKKYKIVEYTSDLPLLYPLLSNFKCARCSLGGDDKSLCSQVDCCDLGKDAGKSVVLIEEKEETP